jgi:hypothetical protein
VTGRRPPPDPVSDALDRLTTRKFELEGTIRLALVVWDGMATDLKVDPAMADVMEMLRTLVPK